MPVDGMDQRASGRDPASDDAVVALMADDDIGLAEGSVANDADEDDSRAVHRDPADAKVESSIGLIAGLVVGQVVALDEEAVAGQYSGSRRARSANDGIRRGFRSG